MPPEGASETDLERHRLAKIVDGLIDRKVQSIVLVLRFFYDRGLLLILVTRQCCALFTVEPSPGWFWHVFSGGPRCPGAAPTAATHRSVIYVALSVSVPRFVVSTVACWILRC